LSTEFAARTISRRPQRLNRALWVAQGLLALTFVGGGLWKLVTPLSEIAALMPWAGQVAPSFFYATAVIDILGGLGVVLPAITRRATGLTVLAALGCAVLQTAAIAFHFSRGEAANTPFNFLLLALALWVAWGRRAASLVAHH
jgi:DoxX-like family